MFTIMQLYKRAQETRTSLLFKDTTHSWVWWNEYNNNTELYDRLFARHYKSFIYYMQDEGDEIDTVLSSFKRDVECLLVQNAKKYSELYRIEQINDATYSLTNNYDMSETMSRRTTGTGAMNVGARTDSESIGARSDTASSNSDNKVSPYDTNSLYPESASSTTGATTTGAQSNSSTMGAQSNSSNSSGTENYTITRVGNIGTMTATDMLLKHNDFWDSWSFMERILRDLNVDLLHTGESDYLNITASQSGGGGSFDIQEILDAIAEVKAEVESVAESIESESDRIVGAVHDDSLLLGQSIVSVQTNISSAITDAKDEIIDEITEVTTNGY